MNMIKTRLSQLENILQGKKVETLTRNIAQ